MTQLEGLRVCFLAGTLQQGGAERQLLYMLHALRDSGASVDLLCLTRGDTLEPAFEAAGFAPTWVGEPANKLLRLRAIVARLRRRPADVVQSQHFYANAYVAAAARLVGARDVGAIRSNGLNEAGEARSQGRLNLRAPRLIAANSRAAIDNVTALGYPASKFHLLPNAVDTDRFRPSERTRGPLQLLAVGRLTRVKRFDRLLNALAEVRKRSPEEVTGLIVGGTRTEAELEPELHAQAEALGLLADGLRFGGAQDDMAPVYARADALVLTSDWEGTPNVVLEAMAAGLPVVCTRVGDVPSIVQDGRTGYLVDPDDGAALVEVLLRLTGDPDLRAAMGARAREWVEANRSPASLPRLLDGLYEAARA